MDMGDILAQWDDLKKKEKAAANPMEIWLRKYGTIDKDKIAEEHTERTKQ